MELGMAGQQPWYSDGLRFQCTQCGDCCSGAPGFVWVTNEEIQWLADELQISTEEFEKVYVRQVGIRRSLREFPNGDCVFFDTEKRNCQVYNARPKQCRTWPFWDSNLKSPDAWKHTCEVCPGAGKGKLYQLPEIEKQRTVVKI
jgi:hypothetical protein